MKNVYLKSLLFGAICSFFYLLIRFAESVYFDNKDAATALSEIRFFPDFVVFLIVFSISGYFLEFKNHLILGK